MSLLAGFLLLWSTLAAQILAGRLGPFDALRSVPEYANDNISNLNPPPSQDPWYQPPANWQLTAPGTVLRTRPSAYKYIPVANAVDVFQTLYRTTDAQNNPSWAVTTIFTPAAQNNCTASKPETCPHGVVSYQMPYDSADADACPSYLLQFGELYGEMIELLARGWFVSVPDYEGPLASYMSGMQSGHATLDSVRAVLNVSSQLGIPSKPRVVLWGYSGGALATEFAAELTSTYAPELQLAGALIGGTAPNMTTAGELMNSNPSAGLLITGILGLTSQNKAARDAILSRLIPTGPVYNASVFLAAQNMSASEALVVFAYADVYKFFQNGYQDLWNPAVQAAINSDASMGHHGIPSMPTFFYKAVHDEFSPVNETDALIARYCRQGANILYHRNALGGHNEEIYAGHQRVYDYMENVLDGKSEIYRPIRGCAMFNVSVAINGTNMTDWTRVDRLRPTRIKGREWA